VTVSLLIYQDLELPTSSKPIFSVPFERDKQFVGRESILSEIKKHLSIQHRVSISGLGGIGYVSSVYHYYVLTHCPENLKLPLNMHIVMKLYIPKATCSGCTRRMLLGSIKLTKILHGS
jgi:hypothetical protein